MDIKIVMDVEEIRYECDNDSKWVMIGPGGGKL
jgi:phosphoribosyl-AMP cyclohydrolase